MEEVERIFRDIRKPNEKLIRLNILLVVYFHDKRYDAAMAEVALLMDNPDMAEYKAGARKRPPTHPGKGG